MTRIETVKEDCLYQDCAYRGKMDGADCCDYILVTGRPRGCLISECDKYRRGRRKLRKAYDVYRFYYSNEIIER